MARVNSRQDNVQLGSRVAPEGISFGATSQYRMRDHELRDAVETEIASQREKFGAQDHHALAWLAIIAEEVGEANRAVIEVLQNQQKGDPRAAFEWRRNAVREMVQIIAVATEAVRAMDRDSAWREVDIVNWERPAVATR